MLFTYPNIANDFEKILRKWFKQYKELKPINDLFFGRYYNPHMYSQHEFLSLSQALESFHRRKYNGKYITTDKFIKNVYPHFVSNIPNNLDKNFRQSIKNRFKYLHEYSLRKRLREILIKYKNIYGNKIGDRKQFVIDVVDSRNYLTHYDITSKGNAKKGRDLLILTDKLNMLLLICLKGIGFLHKTVKNIIENNRRLFRLE